MGCTIEVSFVFFIFFLRLTTEQTPLRGGKVISLWSMDHTTKVDLKRVKICSVNKNLEVILLVLEDFKAD